MKLPINEIICGKNLTINNIMLLFCADRVIPEKAEHPEPPCCTIISGTITGDSMKYYKNTTVNGKEIRLHRALMEAHIGRKLKSSELVHHIDGDIHNNDLSNLAIVTHATHIQIHHFGEATRFKKKYSIDREKLRFLYEDGGLTIQAMANLINVNFGVIWRRMKEYKIRENMICTECGRNIEQYVRARQCNRCYQRAYQRIYRVKQRRIYK